MRAPLRASDGADFPKCFCQVCTGRSDEAKGKESWCLVALLPLRENGVAGDRGAACECMNPSEASELPYPLGRSVKCKPLWKTVWQVLKQLIECDPANLVLYPREMDRRSPQTLVH